MDFAAGVGCVLCDGMRKKQVQLKVAHSHGMQWDRKGRGFEWDGEGPKTRRPDCDFGTPPGDLLIDPWMQEALRKP